MEIYKKSGTKERLFEMMSRVNKVALKETFDVPKEKDDKYLDKSVDTDGHLQVTKKDDGVRYPAIDKLKVDDPSLEGLKGDDLPFNEAINDNGEEDLTAPDDIPTEDTPPTPEEDVQGDSMEADMEGSEEPAYDEDMGGDAPAELPAPDEEMSSEEQEELPMNGDQDGGHEIEGGLADDAQPSDFDADQLAMGLKIEMEHTNDPKIALEIAMDHLVEIPDYYSRLQDMEAEAKEDNGDSAEQALLDPSTHWVDDYVPKNVDEAIFDNPQVPDDAEAGEDRYKEEQSANQYMALDGVSKELAQLRDGGDVNTLKKKIESLQVIPMTGQGAGGNEGLGHRELQQLGYVKVGDDDGIYVKNISNKDIAMMNPQMHSYSILKSGETNP